MGTLAMVFRLLLVLCTAAVCSGQCPLGSSCTDNSIFLSPEDDWKAGIENAPTGSIVFLSAGVYTGECNVVVQQNLTLQSVSGKSETALDCQHRNRHFHVTGATVTIRGLTLTNGNSNMEGGGCVLVDGNATVMITGSSLSVCNTLSNGGVIKLVETSTLLLSDETELRNGSAGGHGGGVFLEKESRLVAAQHVSIVGCEAVDRGGGLYGTSSSAIDLSDGVEISACVGDRGGGVYVERGSTLRAERNVSFVGCEAVGSGGGIFGSSSCAIDLSDGIEISGCVAGDNGGGMYLQVESTLRAERSVSVVGCEAFRGGGIAALSSCAIDLSDGVQLSGCVAADDGGGVYLQSGSSLRAERNVAFVGCEALDRGGGITAISSSAIDLNDGVQISGCVAADDGGGVYMSSGCSLRAERNVSFVGCEAVDRGGGLYVLSSTIDLSDETEISGCVAGTLGGGVYVSSSTLRAERNVSFVGCEASSGGGLFGASSSAIDLSDGTEISGCVAGGNGGGIFGSSSCAIGLSDGVQILGCVAGDNGGGVYLQVRSTLRAERSVSVVGCEAFRGGGIAALSSCAIDLSDGVQLSGCVAAEGGGGVYLQSGSSLRAERNVAFVGCEALDRGGGLYGTLSSAIDLNDGVQISGCVAGTLGGGVYMARESSLRAERNVAFVRCESVEHGGGIASDSESSIDLRDGVQILGCVAGENGGGVYMQLGSTLRAERNVSFVGCEAVDHGGGVFGVAAGAIDLRDGTEISGCVAGNDGGGVCLDDGIFNATFVRFELNVARSGEGGTLFFQDSSAEINDCMIRHGSAGSDGGCISVRGASAVTARDTSLDECVAGTAGEGAGGALAIKDSSTATLEGRMVFSRSFAGEGGAIFSQGSELRFTGGTLSVRDNKASGRGGGIAAWAPFHLYSGSARLSSNHAEIGGGWCGISHTAVLSLGMGANLMVENCTAAQDGGGMALLDLAALVFEPDSEPCPWSSGCLSGECLTAPCNFIGEEVTRRFEEAGQEALQACDREKCPIVDERWDGTQCGNVKGVPCLTASCDWAENNQPCRHVLDRLGSCPLFDAVAYDSMLRQGSRLTFVKEGGTANGFGRCANSTCQVAPAQNGSDSYEWCETIDDGGRLLEQRGVNVGPPYPDVGPSWGVCSPGRPRLPSTGFDYDGASLLELLDTPVEDVMRQYPGCGRNPLRLVSNHAGGKGGGLYSSGCYSLEESKGVCFIGKIKIGQEPSLMVLIHGNSAPAGGGMFSACQELGACAGLLDKKLGLPSRNKTYSSILEFRDNAAGAYGGRAASAAKQLAVSETNQTRLVPGQDYLNVTLWLLDSLQQQVDGRIDAYVIEMVVCAASAGCNSASSLQPVLFLAYDGIQVHTAERNAGVQYCTSGDSSLTVQFTALTQAQNLKATLSVECLPCGHGQARTTISGSSQGLAGPVLWSCESCSSSEYVVDPNRHTCQPCPAGALCNKGSLVGRVQGSVWEADEVTGQYRLLSCPPGHEIVNKIDGTFSHDSQRCRPCLDTQYILNPNTDQCQKCPPGLRCFGADRVEAVVQNSSWQASGSVYKLASCPAGYAVVPGADKTFDAEIQQCVACDKGQECVSPPCVVCTPCQPGYYKSAAGVDACEACPADTFRVQPGAAELAACESCPEHSSTRQQTGQTSSHACVCDAGFYAVASEECVTCPRGAECDGETLITRDGLDATGEVVWARDAQTDRWQLQQCPRGYRLERSHHDAQECVACGPGAFIMASDDPDLECQKCPDGLICFGGGPPVYTVPVSGQLALSGLQVGSDVASLTALEALIRGAIRAALGGDAAVSVELPCQDLAECSALLSSRRAKISPRRSGFVLAVQMASTDATGSLGLGDLDTFAASPAFGDALAEQFLARGQTITSSFELVETSDQSSSVGIYEFDSEIGALKVISCPSGFLLVNSSLESQKCKRCDGLTYSLSPLDGCVQGPDGTMECADRVCQNCPVGAVCPGGDGFLPIINGSVWEVDVSGSVTQLRLAGCPRGYLLVRGSQPANDFCFQCPGPPPLPPALPPSMLALTVLPLCMTMLTCVAGICVETAGKYSLREAVYPHTMSAADAATGALDLCIECSDNAECTEGDKVNAVEGYWRGKDVDHQSRVYRCSPGLCKGGGADPGQEVCRAGHRGEGCATCREGYGMQARKCTRCEDDAVGDKLTYYLFLPLLGLALVILWYWFALRPLFVSGFGMESKIWGYCLACCSLPIFQTLKGLVSNLRDTGNATKIVFSFAQVFSALLHNLEVDWPERILAIMQWCSLLQLEFVDLPGAGCLLREASYFDKLKAQTLFPFVILAWLGLPSVYAMATGLVFYGGRRAHPKYEAVVNRFFQSVFIVAFIIYPSVSNMTMRAFRCKDYGADGLWLEADHRISCNGDEYRSILIWAGFCVAIYPIGIPAFMLGMMIKEGVRSKAAEKSAEARLQAMLVLWKRQTSTLVGTGLSFAIGNRDDAEFEERVLDMFAMGMEVEGCPAIPDALCPRRLRRAISRITDIPEARVPPEQVEALFTEYARDGKGISLIRLRQMMHDVVTASTIVTGQERSADLTMPQLLHLLKHPWDLPIPRHMANSEEELEYNFAWYESEERLAALTQTEAEQQGRAVTAARARRRNSILAMLQPQQASLSSDPQEIKTEGAATRTLSLESLPPIKREQNLEGLSEQEVRQALNAKSIELKAKNRIAVPGTVWSDDGDATERRAIARLGFVFLSYRCDMWWFELAMMLYKLLMSSALIFLFKGTPSQVAAGFLITFACLILLILDHPFVNRELFRMQVYALTIQTLNLFFGMMIISGAFEESIGGDGHDPYVAGFMTALNIVVFLLPFFLVYVVARGMYIRYTSTMTKVGRMLKTSQAAPVNNKAVAPTPKSNAPIPKEADLRSSPPLMHAEIVDIEIETPGEITTEAREEAYHPTGSAASSFRCSIADGVAGDGEIEPACDANRQTIDVGLDSPESGALSPGNGAARDQDANC